MSTNIGGQTPLAKIMVNSVWNLMELSLRGVLSELATVSQWWVRRADLSFCSHSFAEEKIEAIEEAALKYRALIYYGPRRLPSQLPWGGQGGSDTAENRWRLHLPSDSSC